MKIEIRYNKAIVKAESEGYDNPMGIQPWTKTEFEANGNITTSYIGAVDANKLIDGFEPDSDNEFDITWTVI